MKRSWALAAAVVTVATAFTVARSAPIEIGAIYPTAGSAGRGGIDEYRGARLAAQLINARGGVDGRTVKFRLEPAESSDQAARAVDTLASHGVPVIVGSYGSTISKPAADRAQQRDIVFWETGAVGELSMAAIQGDLVFRFPPTGGALGIGAVRFARDVLLPKLDRDPADLRYGVVYVDDVYGRSVGIGAVEEVRRSGYTLAGVYPYDLLTADYRQMVREMKAARIDVLFVSAYLDDGIALRKESVRQRLPLVASVGTSSSYCMHEFGVALGEDAVGLFASDKPDGHVLDPKTLTPEAGAALAWARAEFERRYDHEMTAAALTGFAGVWALLRHVMPEATSFEARAIASAARRVRVETGALPNGSGLEFPARGPDNLRATSVIWEWVKPQTRAVVWPPAFATAELLPIIP